MASGKLSPRQKMINMMYLVLTALLALNVSKEVLNSFFEVNKGVERTTKNFNNKNSDTYKTISDAAANNAEKYGLVNKKAEEIKAKADALVDTLQKMKYELVLKADGEVYLGDVKDFTDDKGKLIKSKATKLTWDALVAAGESKKAIGELNKKDDRNSSGDLFYNEKRKENRATILKANLESFKKFLLDLAVEDTYLTKSISETFTFEDKKEKAGGKKVAWEHYNFHDMPAVAALTLLSKMQADVRNAEADMIEYLKRDLDAKTLKFDDAKGIAIPVSNFVLSGDVFQADIFITAMNKKQDPEVYIGGYDSIAPDDFRNLGTKIEVKNGVGVYTTRTSAVGPKKWGGVIKMQTEQGPKFYSFKGDYLVASKQAVASPTDMNVLYVAVDNGIKVAVAGYSAGQVTITSSNGSFGAVKKESGEWTVTPTKEGTCTIDMYVTDKGKRISMGSSTFRVKDVPDPKAQAAGIPISTNATTVSRTELSGAQLLKAYMGSDFLLDPKKVAFAVSSYRVLYTNANGTYNEKVNGNGFSKEVTDAIKTVASGGTITFTDIKASRRGYKGTYNCPPLTFIVK